MNGDDRWPDVLLQRLHAQGTYHIAVVDAGIGGNQVIGPASYSPSQPTPGGPSALDRLDRDVLSLSGVTSVIWLEGINDFSKNGNASADAVIAGMKQGVARISRPLPRYPRDRRDGHHGAGQHQSRARQRRTGQQAQGPQRVHPHRGTVRWRRRLRPGHADPVTGEMRPEFVPESTTGGPGEKLHPNRAGYEAMAASVDLAPLLAGPLPSR